MREDVANPNINYYGPVVQGFLNLDTSADPNNTAVIINYAWVYDDASDVYAAQELINDWTNTLGENGFFNEKISNFKFWYNVQGFVASLCWSSIEAYNNYTDFETAQNMTFYQSLSENASSKRKALYFNGDVTSFSDFSAENTFGGVPQTLPYGSAYYGIVNGGMSNSDFASYNMDDVTYSASQ